MLQHCRNLMFERVKGKPYYSNFSTESELASRMKWPDYRINFDSSNIHKFDSYLWRMPCPFRQFHRLITICQVLLCCICHIFFQVLPSTCLIIRMELSLPYTPTISSITTLHISQYNEAFHYICMQCTFITILH